jgi:hypothetical protein
MKVTNEHRVTCWYASTCEYKDKGTDLISGFCREEDEFSPIIRYYAVYTGNSLTTFRYNISVPPSRVKKSKVSWIS